MKKIKIVLILLLCSPFIFAQNLIKNGGFEDNVGIPNEAGQYYLCADWLNCGGFGTPDYYHLDGVGNASLPNNYVSNVLPFDGDAIMGIFLYESDPSVTNFREYLGQQLTDPLVVGQKYQLTFYISNGTTPFVYGGYACDNFGVAFSTYQLFQPVTPNDWVIDFSPQFVYEGFLYSHEWQLVTYEFVADSAYQYITFGSFVDDETQAIQFVDAATQSAGVNYYIDEVRLASMTATSNQHEVLADVSIHPNPFSSFLKIEMPILGDYEFVLFDALGRKLLRQRFEASLKINTSSYNNGTYYYQLISEGSVFKSDLLIKVSN